MRDLIRPMLPMIVILAVPIVPFLLFGAPLERALETWREHPPAPHWTALAVIGLLAGDIFLPIPSSLVSTLAGWQLGPWLGGFVTWCGMNIGAAIGFAIARRWGTGVAQRFGKDDDLRRAARLADRFGSSLLALTRGIPVLAEATVLWMGMHKLPWRSFWPPVLVANLLLAFGYSLLGHYAEQHDWLPMALAASVAVPVGLAALMRNRLKVEGEE